MKRKTWLSVLAVAMTSLPLIALAQGFVPCGDEGEPACQLCYLASMIDSIATWLVGILAVITAIIFIVAGLRLVTSAGNTSEKENAKRMISNTFIGFVIVLAAWIIVDFMIQALVNPGSLSGPWSTISCTAQPEAQSRVLPISGAADSVSYYGISSAAALAAADTYAAGDCSPANLESYGFTTQQANVMSCIAAAESGCNTNADNPSSSARGLFQITRGWDDDCHNLNIPECEAAAQAAGWTGSGDLNCSTAFRGGDAIPGNPLAAICDAAASNEACNIVAARCLLNAEASRVPAGYGHWTGTASNPHPAQIACVQRYGG